MQSIIRPLFLLSLFIVTIGSLAACGVLGGGLRTGDDLANPFADGANAFVVCSEGCRGQGQCGMTNSNGTDVQVVLVNPGNPATRGHGAFVQANEAVTIMERREMNMKRDLTGEAFQMNFYRVRYAPASGQQVEGWTHGMCVANRASN